MPGNYEVTSQVEGLDLSDPSRPIETMSITARTIPSGVTFTVGVPLSAYTAAHVAEVLTDRAATIEKVHAGEV